MGFHDITTEPASSTVRVELDGEVIAESDDAIVLREGRLPARYYLTLQDVRVEALRPSDTRTTCPWKGEASYYSVGEHRDLAWTYLEPREKVAAIRGRVAFYNDRVALFVGGERVA